MKILEEKRGWIIIIEAVIAVLILFGFLFTTISKQAEQIKTSEDKEEYFYDLANELAIKAEKNNTIRELIFDGDCFSIKKELEKEINKVNVSVEIENSCGPVPPLPEKKEIYASEIMIATNFTHYKIKKLKIFIW